MWIVGLLWLYPSTEIRESHWSDNDIKTNVRRWSVTKTHRKSHGSTSCFRSVWTNQRSVRDQSKAYWTVQTLNTRSVLNLQSFVLQSRVDSEYWCVSSCESSASLNQDETTFRESNSTEPWGEERRSRETETPERPHLQKHTISNLTDTPLVALVLHFTFILVIFIVFLDFWLD